MLKLIRCHSHRYTLLAEVVQQLVHTLIRYGVAVDVIDIVATKLRYAILDILIIRCQLLRQRPLYQALNTTAYHLPILCIGMLREVARTHNIVYRRCQIAYGIEQRAVKVKDYNIEFHTAKIIFFGKNA